MTRLLWISCLFFAACGGETVSKQQYDEVYGEYKLLKESLDASQSSNLEQAATLNKTLNQLAEISSSTLALRGDIESGTAQITQAERISSSIQAIKSKISSLENSVTNDGYKKMVKNLKTIIDEKEKEINALKDIIESQNSTITEQKGTIDEQQQQLGKQQQQIGEQHLQLVQAVKDQAALLYQAASEFEKFASDVPDVSRKKNKKKVMEWAISMLQRAQLYYEKSQGYGINASQAITRVKTKIIALERETD